jgi:di/tricarboxylate transporter
MQIAIVLGLLVVAIGLFATEKLSVDVVTLLIVIILTLTQILTPEEAFSGFSSDFIIILASVFIISGALQDTGILDNFGAQISRVNIKNSSILLIIIMLATGAVSAFMNNTTVTALFLGPITGLCRKLKISPSQLLMPLAFASILGGTCTVIGTSTNVAVSGYIVKAGLDPIGLFELLPIGAMLFAVGLIYMVTIGKFLLPKHPVTDLAEKYAVRDYLTEIIIMDDSPLIGQHVFESDLNKLDFTILRVIRDTSNFMPKATTIIQPDDVLLVEGKMEELIKVKETEGIEIKADLLMEDLTNENIKLAEVIITPRSSLINCTPKQANFLQKYGLKIMAVHRNRSYLRDKLGDIHLAMGDMLLVQGPSDKIDSAQATDDFAILGQISHVLYKKRRGWITIGIFIIAIFFNMFNVAPLSISFLGAALLVALVNKLSAARAYQMVDWRLLILIGGMSAFGVAMEKTGASSFLADYIVWLLQPLGITFILAGFVILTVLLTQPMSNAAAALVVLPVALQVAEQLQVNPRPFAIAIMLAASVSLITPFEPSCILVYGPGKYKFMDFLKTGSLLTAIMVALIVFMVPVLWKM